MIGRKRTTSVIVHFLTRLAKLPSTLVASFNCLLINKISELVGNRECLSRIFGLKCIGLLQIYMVVDSRFLKLALDLGENVLRNKYSKIIFGIGLGILVVWYYPAPSNLWDCFRRFLLETYSSQCCHLYNKPKSFFCLYIKSSFLSKSMPNLLWKSGCSRE